MIELYVNGQAVDLAPNTKITLNFASNIFGDISKINASNSFTINLPKTTTNRSVFGMPMSSAAPYKQWSADIYVNGVSIVDAAHLVLLSVGENYEVALYWGVASDLQSLKDSDKTLRDIKEVLSIKYGGDNWWNTYRKGTDKNGVENYNICEQRCNCGVGNLRDMEEWRTQFADLPFVNVGWVWSQIVKDNNLQITIPDNIVDKMHELGMPFTTREVEIESFSFSTRFLNKKVVERKIQDAFSGLTRNQDVHIIFYQISNNVEKNDAFEMLNEEVEIELIDKKHYTTATVYKAKNEHTCIVEATVEYKENFHPVALLRKYNKEKGEWEDIARAEHIVKAAIELKAGDMICLEAEPNDKLWYIGVDSASIKYTISEGISEATFGNDINTADNLPTIKQIDFIKAMCQMFGLWVTLIGDSIHFQSYDSLYESETIDWSNKLIGTGDADAGVSDFKVSDYAQSNILAYKADKTSEVDASGALVVENTTLDQSKEMVTLPFAATDGNTIPWYKWKDEYAEELELETQKIEPRIVKLNTGDESVDISFSGLSFTDLLNDYYTGLQRMISKPVVIEEKFRLTEIDIKDLDYRKTIYLQKYGAKFVIDKVQWSDDGISTVTLVKLPSDKNIGVELPYKVNTGVSIGFLQGPTQVPTIYPSLAYMVKGAGEYWAETAKIEFKDNTGMHLFDHWEDETGRLVSYENPYYYDGHNGDITLYANVIESLIS